MQKENIINIACMRYSQLGMQAVSIQDIATDCGISKKTLYQFFGNKQQLVEAVVLKQVAESNHFIRVRSGIAHDALTEIIVLFKCAEFVAGLFPTIFFHELKRYYHEAYHFVTTFFSDNMIGRFLQNISRGMEEGCYKADLNKEMVVSVYSWQMQNAIENVSNLNVNRLYLVQYTNQCFLLGVLDLDSILIFTPDWKIYMQRHDDLLN